MKLILQQLRRDLAACRWPLVAYAALVVLHTLLAAWFLQTSARNPAAGGGLGGWIEFSDGLFIVAGLLALWVVLLDPPADPDAFWQARPLRWFHLLAAKLVFIVGCLVVPLLVVPAILLGAAGAPGLWSVAMWDFAQTRLPIILVLAAAATLARNLKEGLLVLGGFVVFIFAVSFTWLLLREVFPIPALLQRLEFTWGRLLNVGTIAPTLLTIILVHFARRRVRLTALAAAAVLTLTLAADLSPQASRWRQDRRPLSTTGDPLPAFAASIRDDRTYWNVDGETGIRLGVSARLDIERPEAPYTVIPEFFTASEVRFPDGDRRDTLATIDPWRTWNPADSPAYQNTFQAAVPGYRLMNPNPHRVPAETMLMLANYDQMQVKLIDREWPSGRETVRFSYHPQEDQGRVGTFVGILQFEVQRLDTIARLPLQRGAGWADGADKLLVLGINSYPGQGTALTIRKQFVWPNNLSSRMVELSFLLARPDRKEAYLTTSVGRSTRLRIHPFSQAEVQLIFRTGDDPAGNVIPEDWLAEAEVLAVHRVSVGSTDKPLRVDNFRLWPEDE